MVRNHRKPLKAMVATSKTIVKPLMAMVRPPKKHSMVMVSSKTIENLQWSLQNYWNLQWFPKKHWICQWSPQINILLKQLNYPVVTITILIWLCCSKVYCQSSLIFIASPSLTSKPLLTIALKILKTIEKPLIPMVGPPKKH